MPVGHYDIFCATTGGLLTPRTPVAHTAATSSVGLSVPYIRAGAYAPLHDFTASRKIALKRRVPSAHLRSASRNLSARFAGMYPANCPPIRSRPWPGFAAAPRGCWLAALSLLVLQQPQVFGVRQIEEYVISCASRTGAYFPACAVCSMSAFPAGAPVRGLC